MNAPGSDMSTDDAWEAWGRKDPYFGVITDPRYRRTGLDAQARDLFFATGQGHVDYLLATIRRRIDPGFAPRSILDFGCGVGRVLVPFAALAGDVVGLDVSPSMLDEARRNCDERQLRNVRLLVSDDRLSGFDELFDFVHSCIVFQHIPAQRGRAIFLRLIERLRPGGVGAIQLVYSKARYAPTQGIPPPESLHRIAAEDVSSEDSDPIIQMNPYNMTEVLFAMQASGIGNFYTDFTDHGGELGVFLFFQMPPG